MTQKKLIPILATVQNLRKRRVKNSSYMTNSWSVQQFNQPVNTTRLLRFVERMTTGRFFTVPRAIAFEDEQDMVIFKLGFNVHDS